MAGTSLVSVVTPDYNAQPHLDACLDSICYQAEVSDMEVIVVDDGCADATGEIARRRPEVQYRAQANRGPSAARNAGVARARGEFIAFLDADDLCPAGI